ncbi:MAG: glycosyltransferase [Dehalococcoidia bacterium]
MRLLILQETDWLKRYPAQQHHLAEMMALRGHEVLAIDYELSWRTGEGKGLRSKRTVFHNISKIHPDAGITVIRPGFVRLPLLDYLSVMISHRREIKRQIKEFRPDVIIGFGILNSCSAVRLVKNTGIPFVYYWLDALHLLIPTRPFHALGRFLEGYALKRSAMALAINEGLRELMVKLGAPAQRTHLLRAGIDTGRFDLGIDGGKVRQKYGIAAEDRVLFFMGFLYHFSGLKEVARELAARGENSLKLIIVGEGDAYEELKAIRDKHGLQHSLIMTGKKPYREIPELIAAADICILPAYPNEPIMQDIVPIKLYEYMAMQKPVVATRLPGVMKEFGENNGVVYVKKPEDAVTKSTELIQSGKIEELGSKARSFAEMNSWDSITDEFEKILEETVESSRSKGSRH